MFVATGKCKGDEDYDAYACHIGVDKENANSTLCKIYKNAFVSKEKKVLPIDLVCSELTSLDALKVKLEGDYGAWKYFEGKEVFLEELEKHSGYTQGNFKKEWGDACKTQQELLGESLLGKIKK